MSAFVSLDEGCSFDGVGLVVEHKHALHKLSTFIKNLSGAVVNLVKYRVPKYSIS